MDFKSFTSDDLLAALPSAGEDDRWELKSAFYLDSKKRGELKNELGKQVSAFANSGGGYLVFGVSNTRQLEPCEQLVGRQPMKDFLATMVEQCVEYPIRHFQVHRIPFKDDPDKSVFVVAIEDSPAAPHQAKDDKIYYYRIDGHSKPAPHFHVELLRHRLTRTVLQIKDVDYILRSCEECSNGVFRLGIALNITVENVSLQSASEWGVHLKHHREHFGWQEEISGKDLAEGVFYHSSRQFLLPTEKATLCVRLQASSDDSGIQACEKKWEHFGVVIRPISQNHVGNDFFFGSQDHMHWIIARGRFREELTRLGISST